jgi:oxalate decarboxylase/phosphoglucose isomerase-like protein (cupin superfamily)
VPAVDPNSLPTQTFEWGSIKWLVSPATEEGAGVTFGEVVLLPGKGHDRHNHPDAEEVLYVLSGEGEQMVDDAPPFAVSAGSAIYVPTGVFHSTRNTGWAPMRLLALYNPAGAEKALSGLPDFREEPAGTIPGWSRA